MSPLLKDYIDKFHIPGLTPSDLSDYSDCGIWYIENDSQKIRAPFFTPEKESRRALREEYRMINVNWSNPYAGASGRWLKGNLHTHTSPSSGCSVVAPADMLAMYEKAGYDFLSLSDHMSMIDAPATRLTLIPGIEWNSSTGEHAGVYSLNPKYPRSAIDISDQRLLLERHGNVDALLILNHPDWQLTPHYRREALLGTKGI